MHTSARLSVSSKMLHHKTPSASERFTPSVIDFHYALCSFRMARRIATDREMPERNITPAGSEEHRIRFHADSRKAPCQHATSITFQSSRVSSQDLCLSLSKATSVAVGNMFMLCHAPHHVLKQHQPPRPQEHQLPEGPFARQAEDGDVPARDRPRQRSKVAAACTAARGETASARPALPSKQTVSIRFVRNADYLLV